MSATNQASFLGLSSWLSGDKPQRSDFNSDNQKVDDFAAEHTSDMQHHLSDEDREKFDLPYYMGVYYGDNQASRTVATQCPFEPQLCMVFCINSAVQQSDFEIGRSVNRVGLASVRGGTPGIGISGCNITVQNIDAFASSDEWIRLNESGKTYFYFLLR